MHLSNLVSNIIHLSHAGYLSNAKDIDGQILSLDCAKREQIQKFRLAEGDGDKVHEPKGLLTF